MIYKHYVKYKVKNKKMKVKEDNICKKILY